MAEKRDYYEVLGVDRSASPEEMKKSYRRKARELHPDVNRDDPHAEEHFKELGEAYEVLSNQDKRAVYDRFGHAGLQGNGGGGGAYGGGFPGGSPFGDFSEIFETFFGGGMAGGSRPDPRGSDLQFEMEITLEEAASGVEHTIQVPRPVVCNTCHGSGAESGGPVPCPACAGTGQRRQVASNLFGMQFTTLAPCDRCGATGEIIAHPCKACNGAGRVRGVDEVTVPVPPGVDTGQRMRFSGKGGAGLRGAQPGDLYVVMRVKPHPIFKRSGDDLFCEAGLPFATAALGGKLKVPTLDGDTDLDVPPGTQPGQRFRVRGKGMPHLHATHQGDLHVQMRVEVPTDLNAKQKELLRDFALDRGENIDYKPKGIFQKAKEAIEDVVDASREVFGN